MDAGSIWKATKRIAITRTTIGRQNHVWFCSPPSEEITIPKAINTIMLMARTSQPMNALTINIITRERSMRIPKTLFFNIDACGAAKSCHWYRRTDTAPKMLSATMLPIVLNDWVWVYAGRMYQPNSCNKLYIVTMPLEAIRTSMILCVIFWPRTLFTTKKYMRTKAKTEIALPVNLP
jgi:hypothetical protein